MNNHARTTTEKIVHKHAVGYSSSTPPQAGDSVVLSPQHLMTHDNTSAVIPKFRAIAGADASVYRPERFVIAIDHDIQNYTPENLGKYARIRDFAQRQGFHYYPPGRGIAHQVMIEEGFVRPGGLVVASDSHSNMYGALACLGTPVVRTDAAALWAIGQMWWIVPPQVRVTLTGELKPGVSGKDVILALCAAFPRQVMNCCVEFDGPGVAGLSIDDRMTISNMSTEWGALSALFPCDDVLLSWFRDRASERSGSQWYSFNIDHAERDWDAVRADNGAAWRRELTIDLSSVMPHVTGPNSVTRAVDAYVIEQQRVRVDKAYLMSCVNARLSDLQHAAAVLNGRSVAPHVRLYIAAASSSVQAQAIERGIWPQLIAAGAIALPPGCGACIGLGAGTLEAGEVGISSTNRNFEGRMGSRDARCYLASPEVVAESAARGYIAAPLVSSESAEVRTAMIEHADYPSPRGESVLEPWSTPVLSGRTILLPEDDINTDAIYPAEATYNDTLTPNQQAQAAFRNYDPSFLSKLRAGDILVAGWNFGCGSSREQAATAIRACGIAAVVAASMSQTFQRNAINNGILVLESPELYRHLLRSCDHLPRERAIVGPSIEVALLERIATCQQQEYPLRVPGSVPRAIIRAGGLEGWVREHIRSTQP